jgi:hypothetical protein
MPLVSKMSKPSKDLLVHLRKINNFVRCGERVNLEK